MIITMTRYSFFVRKSDLDNDFNLTVCPFWIIQQNIGGLLGKLEVLQIALQGFSR